MSESSRRVHAASRRAATALKGYTEADIAWTEERVIALMLSGVGFVEAVTKAAEECSLRIIERKVAAFEAERRHFEERREEARAKREADQAERRAELEARATLGQRPTLKTTLGAILAARGGRL